MTNQGHFQYEKAIGREQLFLQDSEADFFILFEQKLYCLRKQFLRPSAYFSRCIQKLQRVHVIDQKFNLIAFEKVLSCLYGLECTFQRGKQIYELMEVIRFIECKQLQKLLKKQLISNFNRYNIFFLMEFAIKYIDLQLQSRCYIQFAKQNFQQFNYNRSDLLKCSQYAFKSLIKLHQKLKRSKRIKGIAFQNMRKIIVDYNQVNSTSIDIFTMLTHSTSSIIFQDPEGQLESPDEIFPKLRKNRAANANPACKNNLTCVSLANTTNLETHINKTNITESLNIQKTQSDHVESLQQIKIQIDSAESKNYQLLQSSSFQEAQKNKSSQISTRCRSQNLKINETPLEVHPKKLFLNSLKKCSIKKRNSSSINLLEGLLSPGSLPPPEMESDYPLQNFQCGQEQVLTNQKLTKSQIIKQNFTLQN